MIDGRVFYLGLEPYHERYTEVLSKWVRKRVVARDLSDRFVFVTPPGDTEAVRGIDTGNVLDAHGRTSWALRQVHELIAMRPTPDDCVWIADMFTPGLEALFYVFEQTGWPRIVAQNHAQTFDPDDFVFPWRRWMRPFEKMVDAVCDGFFIGSTIHGELMRVGGMEAPIYHVGLPFDRDDVREGASRGTPRVTPTEGITQVVYASRLDPEKNPHFFMDVAWQRRHHTQFVVCCGGEVRSADPTVVPRLLHMEKVGAVVIADHLSRDDYWAQLAAADAHFLTSSQDFVSYTLLESSSLGTPTIAPCFRSFPEELSHVPEQLYVPWNRHDAERALEGARWSSQSGAPAEWHTKALTRMLDVAFQSIPEDQYRWEKRPGHPLLVNP